MRRTRPCGGDVEQPGERLVGSDVADVQELGGGFEALGPHVLGVRGELQRLRDLRLGDEGALALDALQAPLDDQLLKGLSHGRARGVELGGEGALGRYGCAGRQRLRHVEQMLLEAVVLGHARGTDGCPTLVLRTADVGAHTLPSRLQVPMGRRARRPRLTSWHGFPCECPPARCVILSIYSRGLFWSSPKGRRAVATGALRGLLRRPSRPARSVPRVVKGPCICRSRNGRPGAAFRPLTPL